MSGFLLAETFPLPVQNIDLFLGAACVLTRPHDGLKHRTEAGCIDGRRPVTELQAEQETDGFDFHRVSPDQKLSHRTDAKALCCGTYRSGLGKCIDAARVAKKTQGQRPSPDNQPAAPG